MKYDDVVWHFEADDFPKELPQSAAATHIGVFVTWAIFKGLMSDEFKNDLVTQIEALKNHLFTLGEFLWRFMEGKFSDYDLSEEGKSFTKDYYVSYLKAYEFQFKNGSLSGYLVPDTWDTYHEVSIVIDSAYRKWLDSKSHKP